MMNKIGIVGAGVMGQTVAQRLVEEKKQIIVFDSYAPSIESARKIGATIVKSASAVAKQSDIVLIFLPGPSEVKLCVSAEDGLLAAAKAGLIIVDLSTVDPATTCTMADAARLKGVEYLDAPVLGRPSTVGHWALPVGGNKTALASCEELLRLFAAHVIHIGDSGSGNKVKLLNQMMFGAINAMTAEMMAVSNAIGIPPKLLYETIVASQAGTVSNLFKELGARVSQEDYENPTFTVDLLAKDIRLGVQMAKDYKAPPILGRTVEMINEISLTQGYGSIDTSIMWQCYKNIWNSSE
jgi:3-hydroxyisobutyrate dehydrogenase